MSSGRWSRKSKLYSKSWNSAKNANDSLVGRQIAAIRKDEAETERIRQSCLQYYTKPTEYTMQDFCRDHGLEFLPPRTSKIEGASQID